MGSSAFPETHEEYLDMDLHLIRKRVQYLKEQAKKKEESRTKRENAARSRAKGKKPPRGFKGQGGRK